MRWFLPLAVIVVAVVVGGCGGSAGPGVTQGQDLSNGREIFIKGWNGQQSCASCHTLIAAGSTGTIGVNLDDAFRGSREQGFSQVTFEQVVRQQIAYPGIGLGMPADLVEGDDANDVAYFVAKCAGNEADPACKPSADAGKVTATDGKGIFTEAGCGGCHTLAAAGTDGNIGPNLDDAKPPAALVIDRVTNGKGVMPSFKDRLSEEQIKTVADYVSQNAGQ